MSWVVDTCVIIDIALDDDQFGAASADHLKSRQTSGLTVCPVTFVELAPQFDGNLKELRFFLKELGIDLDQPWIAEDRDRAAKAFTSYVQQRRKNTVPKRPVADILIGAFACRFSGLITRNNEDFAPYFPELVLESSKQGPNKQRKTIRR